MTPNQDDPNQNAADAPAPTKHETVVTDYRSLKAAGFSKQQIAQQLSAKHNMTVDEVTGLLDQQADEDPNADEQQRRG